MIRAVLVGNGNSGKTTLYNGITGSSEKTGNWYGVTVKKAQKQVKIGEETVTFIDLPGVVSFEPTSLEENSVQKFLNNDSYDIIINVIDINNFDYGIKITKSLLKFNKPIIVFFNFYKKFLNNGGYFDGEEFFKHTNIHCVLGEATRKKDITLLKNKISGELINPKNFSEKTVLAKCYKLPVFNISKFDKLLFNFKFGLVFYGVCLIFALYLSFGKYGIGKLLAEFLENIFGVFNNFSFKFFEKAGVNDFLARLITDGIFCGVESVLVFVPQIGVLNLILIILEQTGLISRMSYIFNDHLTKFGLNGRALFTLICGFGCTTVALNLTNGLENDGIKKKVCLSLPNVICSAKVPVIFYFANLISGNFVVILFAFSYLCSVVFTLISMKMCDIGLKCNNNALILEIPQMLKLNVKTTIKPLLKNIKEFIIKITKIVTVVSIIIFLLTNIGYDFKITNDIENSILCFIASRVKFIFYPIGVDSWGLTSSLIFGLFAKETIVSTLSITGIGCSLNVCQIFAICVFILLYTPCLTALGEMKNQIGAFWAILSAIFQFFLALCCTYLVYYFLISSVFRNFLLLSLALFFIYKILVRYEKNNSNKMRKITKVTNS